MMTHEEDLEAEVRDLTVKLSEAEAAIEDLKLYGGIQTLLWRLGIELDLAGKSFPSVKSIDALVKRAVQTEAVKRVVEPVTRELEALKRELTRWQEGTQIESDYIKSDGSIAKLTPVEQEARLMKFWGWCTANDLIYDNLGKAVNYTLNEYTAVHRCLTKLCDV